MGHDAHFLTRLQRIGDHRTLDLALGLYRDPRAVELIIARTTLVGDPERVALALDDSERPPHVIVARNGRFVTCLGPGMAVHDCPILSRAEIDAALDQSAAIGRADARIAWKGGLVELFKAVLGGGRRVAREDFDATYVIAPVLQRVLDEAMDKTVGTQEQIVRSLRAGDLEAYDHGLQELLKVYGRGVLTLDLLMLLSIPHAVGLIELGGIESAIGVTAMLVGSAELTTAARVATVAADLGPAAVEIYIERWRKATHLQLALDPFSALAGIAARHPDARAQVLAALDSPPPCAAELIGSAGAVRRGLADAARVEADLRAREREALVREGVSDPDEALVDASIGARNAALLRPMVLRERLPAVLIWAARRRPHDYYLPAAALDRLPEHILPRRVAVGAVRARLAELYDYYRRLAVRLDPSLVAPRAPVRVGPKHSRNAPCPCGSGRKYKRCCLRDGS